MVGYGFCLKMTWRLKMAPFCLIWRNQVDLLPVEASAVAVQGQLQ